MARKTILEVFGAYGPEGWEDSAGVEHFNDRIGTPYGPLENLKTHVVDNATGCNCDDPDYLFDWETGEQVLFHDHRELVIDAAPNLILVSRNPIEAWTAEQQVGATIERSAFGFSILELQARNGMVRYVLKDDDVYFSDEPDVLVNSYLALQSYSQWQPEGPAPARTRSTTTTRKIQ